MKQIKLITSKSLPYNTVYERETPLQKWQFMHTLCILWAKYIKQISFISEISIIILIKLSTWEVYDEICKQHWCPLINLNSLHKAYRAFNKFLKNG